jgi:hypothetical protein
LPQPKADCAKKIIASVIESHLCRARPKEALVQVRLREQSGCASVDRMERSYKMGYAGRSRENFAKCSLARLAAKTDEFLRRWTGSAEDHSKLFGIHVLISEQKPTRITVPDEHYLLAHAMKLSP